MAYVKISDLQEKTTGTLNGLEDILVTDDDISYKLKLNSAAEFIGNKTIASAGDIFVNTDIINKDAATRLYVGGVRKEWTKSIPGFTGCISIEIVGMYPFANIDSYITVKILEENNTKPARHINISSQWDYTTSSWKYGFANDTINVNSLNIRFAKNTSTQKVYIILGDTNSVWSETKVSIDVPLMKYLSGLNPEFNLGTLTSLTGYTIDITKVIDRKLNKNVDITAGTYTKVTADINGLITSGTTLIASDIPNLDASKITTGTISAARLPAYVDDVLEYANLAAFPVTGEAGKIYVALDTNKTYRWSGSTYIYITSGAVDSVAGKTGVVTLVKGDVGLGSVDNTADSAKNVLSATKLTTARTINGVSFDGTSNITVTANTPNSNIIKFDTGTTEGTDLYTFNGSASKTIDIKAGTNVTLTKTASSITINANDTSVGINEVTGMASGASTFLTTPTSANLATLLTDETGSGSVVFNTNPTLVTPNIGVATGTSFNSITGLSSTNPNMDGTAAIGTSTTVARSDHVHPIDTSRAPISSPTFTGTVTTPALTISGTGTITTRISGVASDLTALSSGTTNPIHIPMINVGTTYGFIPMLSTRVQSSAGYVNNNSIGSYRPGSDFTNSGVYIATGGSDSVPTEAFLFQNGRKISSTGGAISLVGNSDTVTNGVYTVGDQSIGGVKTFTSKPQSSGLSTSWGATSTTQTGAYNAVMGTSASATWILSGTSGGVFRSGIQSLDSDGTLRFYQGANYFQFANGVLSATSFTGSVTGNASTATKLQTARTINGVSFDGSTNITITSDALITTSEYVTRMFRNSKQVYGIEVDIGAMPNADIKDVAFTFNAAYTYWIDNQNSYCANSTASYPLNYAGNIGESISCYLDRTNNLIKVLTSDDKSTFTGKVVILYTK